MFKSKMDLRIKLMTLPFTEFEFYKEDKFEKLAQLPSKKRGNENQNFADKLQKKVLPEIYRIVHKNQRIVELDQVELLIKKYYPEEKLRCKYRKNDNIMQYYIERLEELSSYLLTHRNGKIALKYWNSDGEDGLIGPYEGIYKIAFWNSLNRMFTTDILVMLYLLKNDMDDERYLNSYHSLVSLEDVQLEQVFRKGLGETHLHMNAGINFIIPWTELMSIDRTKDKQTEKEILMEEDKVLGKDFDINIHVEAMAIVRILLAYYLRCYKADENESDHLHKFYFNENQFGDIKDDYSNSMNLSNEIKQLLMNIFNGNELSKENRIEIRNIFEELKIQLGIYTDSDIHLNKWDEVLIKKDVLYKILCNNSSCSNTSVENIFLFRSLKYIKSKPDDIFFSKIFQKYLIIKNEVFQLKSQGNLIKGLKNFIDYYSRSTQEAWSRKEYIGLILHNQLSNNHLKKLELRCTVKGDKNDIIDMEIKTKDFLKDFFEVYLEILCDMKCKYKNIQAPLIGLVFHFIKSKDSYLAEKCWMNYKDSGEEWFLNFKEHQEVYGRQVKVINHLREKIPNMDKYIIGIDAASIESDTEPWVFASIYDKARNSDTHKPINLESCTPINNFGFTFHAGEDFRHIITGMRRVDEVIEHFKFHAGDRIGHGISIGLDVDKWVHNNRIVIIPRIEYLENLLWMWGIHKNYKYSTYIDVGYLERKILECAEIIYVRMEGVTVFNLWKAYRKKFHSKEVVKKYKETVTSKNYTDIFCPYAQEERKSDDENCQTRRATWKKVSSENYTDIFHTPEQEVRNFVDGNCHNRRDIWDEDKLFLSYHCRCYLERMNDPIEIEVKKDEIELIKNLQNIVLNKVSNEGIVIETNPTSNTAIGEIDSILEHYICNLNQRGLNKEQRNDNGIIVTINSDDPSVFNTNVSNELSYIFYSLIEKGYAREDVLFWIDRIRENGLRTSFILDDGLDIGEKIIEISDIIQRLNE